MNTINIIPTIEAIVETTGTASFCKDYRRHKNGEICYEEMADEAKYLEAQWLEQEEYEQQKSENEIIGSAPI